MCGSFGGVAIDIELVPPDELVRFQSSAELLMLKCDTLESEHTDTHTHTHDTHTHAGSKRAVCGSHDLANSVSSRFQQCSLCSNTSFTTPNRLNLEALLHQQTTSCKTAACPLSVSGREA